MSLSLKQQLKKLGTADLKNVSEGSRKYKASFLFTAKEAAEQDLETIFSIARNGFMELLNVDPAFSSFETALFSENSKSIDRVLMSKQDNEKLDQTIASFLCQLSPYFLLNPAGKVLEWLIRRFDIHKCNVDAILACIFPFHETKSFVKMVSLLDIPDNSSWVFLKPIRQSRLPLGRDTLVDRLAKSRFVLDFVCKTVVRAPVPHSTLYTFYAATLVKFIASSRTVSAEMAIALTPYLVEGLAAKSQPELQLASYMILSQLSSKTAFNAIAIESLTSTMVLKHGSDLFRHSMLALIHLAQTQANFTMSDKAVQTLTQDPLFAETLTLHASSFAIDRFIACVIPHLVSQHLFDLLDALIVQGYLSSDNIKTVCHQVIDLYIALVDTDNTKAAEFLDLARQLLVSVSQRHVEELDHVLEAKLQSTSDNASTTKALYDLSNSTLSGTRHQLVEDANTTLFLCLTHPSPNMRLLGIQKLANVLTAGNDTLKDSPDLIEMSLLQCLEEYGELATYALQEMPDILLDYVSLTDLLTTLKARLQEPGAYQHPGSVMIVSFLLNKVMPRHASAATDIARILATFALAASKDQLTQLVSQTKVAKLDKQVLGKMIASVRQAVKKSQPSREFVKLEASGITDGAFWAELLKSTDRLERIVALLVLGEALTLQKKNAAVISLALLESVKHSYGALDRLYTTPLDDAWKDAAWTIPASVFDKVRDLNVLTDDLEINLVQLTVWNMIHLNAVENSASVSHRWYANDAKDIIGTWIQACYSLLVGGTSLGCFEPAVTALISLFLKDQLIAFLVKQWIEQDNVIVKARSLQIGADCIRAYAGQHQRNDFQHLVPTLLPALADEHPTVRAMALTCFKSLLAVYRSGGMPTLAPLYNPTASPGKKSKTATVGSEDVYGDKVVLADVRAGDVAHFVDHFVHFDDEITNDHGFVQHLLTTYYNTCHHAKNKATKEAATHLLNLILDHINGAPSLQLQIDLLRLLSPLDVPNKLDKLIDLLATTLETPPSSYVALSTKLVTALIACYTPVSGHHLAGKKLDVFINLLVHQEVLAGEDEQGWQITTRRCALQQITDDFFATLSPAIQQQLFTLLLDIATNGEQVDVRLAKQVLLQVTLPVALLDSYLLGMAKLLVNDDSATTEATRGRKRTKASAPVSDAKAVDLYELVTVLELIESKNSDQDILLIKPLFEVLTAMINADLRNAPVSLEYIHQLIMSSLTRLIHLAVDQPEEAAKIDESTLRVDVVVQCIRVTGNPQTHNQALLLMATIASVFPERVLHNIMPVFTFMGANVMRLDDNYSFQVIQQTLEKVIPPLVAVRRLETTDATALSLHVKPIIKVFVDALFHIPKHRRLRLFTVLVSTLGQDEFLATVMAQLLEKFTEKKSKGDRSDADTLFEFALVVCQQFGVTTQLKAMLSLFQGLLHLPNDKDDDMQDDNDSSVFNVADHSSKQLRQYKLVTMNLIHQWLSSRHFLAKVMAVNQSLDMAEEDLHPLFLRAVELVLQIVSQITAYRDSYAKSLLAQPAVANYWRALLKVVYEVLTKLNALLPLPAFLQAMEYLIKHPQIPIRRKAMALFHERISDLDHVPEEEELALVDMVKQLTAAMQAETAYVQADEEDPEDALINKQAALLCLAALAGLLGNLHPTAFVEAVPLILGDDGLTSDHAALQVSSLATIAVIYQHVGPRGVPHLPKLMPLVLDLLLNTDHDAVLLAVISTLETLVQVLPHFLSPYLGKMLTGLLAPAIFNYNAADAQREMIHAKTSSVLSTMAAQIPPRILLGPVFQFYDTALANGTESILALYSMVRRTIQAMPRDMVTVHYKQIFKFFLLAFDMRRSKHVANEASLEAMEEAIIVTFMDLVMKLNETLFKPLFLKVVDWATVEQPDDSRALFFYKLLHSLLDKLKSIIAPYVLYVVDDMMERLGGYRDGHMVPDTLWNYLMQTIHKSFLYDNDNLWNADRYDKIMTPVVDQLSVTAKGDADTYLQRMTTYLVPCLGQMAVTVSNDTLWKPLNHQVLMKTREDDPEVRLAALRVIEEFYQRLGDEWLLFLAESISFLAELMEDDDPRVEKLVQQVNAQIETHLGESLDKFFN
ncbi:hypothetical protein DM01DRAFT_1322487 [Hesseltinella vesiculosa]|uniref:U3 small nucleolar RNA-associated protein 10 n=1 Tax=Hesseltinella vesiculosa TaxID=101127 RepID=A0A1X2GGT8_9FUNG|nr:hypothetical protein DM01DRAFT_1322487 [Hesseltinella vesiculosa]